jgi:hypothetical protein
VLAGELLPLPPGEGGGEGERRTGHELATESQATMDDAKLIHLLVEIELEGDAFRDDDESDLQGLLVEKIEERGIGEVGGWGSGEGSMDISVHVLDESVGRERLMALLREVAPAAKYTIQVLPDEE